MSSHWLHLYSPKASKLGSEDSAASKMSGHRHIQINYFVTFYYSRYVIEAVVLEQNYLAEEERALTFM
jgi:hypothetical protein